MRLVVINLLVGRQPLYGVGEWAARYDPGLLGLAPGRGRRAQRRPGRPGAGPALRRRPGQPAHRADRSAVVAEFGVDTDELHNDSTSITVHGDYGDATGAPRGGKPTPVITCGHNKDHRPDLKQLLYILTVSADGAVPDRLPGRDGNTTDDRTHVPTWDELVALLGRRTSSTSPTASCARARRWATSPPAAAGSSPCCPAPAARTSWFRDWAQTHQPTLDRGPARCPATGSATPTRCTRPSPRRCPPRRATASSGCTPPPRPPATPPPARPASRPASPRSTRWPPGWPGRSAGSRPGSRSRRGRRRARPTPAPSRWIELHRRRDRRGDLPPGTPRPPRRQHPLPPPHPHPPHHHLRHPPATCSPTTPPPTAASR